MGIAGGICVATVTCPFLLWLQSAFVSMETCPASQEAKSMLQGSLSLKRDSKCLNEAIEAAMQGNVLPAVRRRCSVRWAVDRSTRCSDWAHMLYFRLILVAERCWLKTSHST